ATFDRAARGAVGAVQADRQRRIESLFDADRGLVLVRRLEARGAVELAVSNDGAGIRVERDRPAIHRLAARATALEELVPRNATGRDRGGALRAAELNDGGRVVVVGLDRGVGREHADVHVRRQRVVEAADRTVQLRGTVADEVP